MAELTTEQRDKLMSELRNVIADAEQLLKQSAGDISETTLGLRERLQRRMAGAKSSLLELQAAAGDKAKAAGHAADDYMHDHPWQSLLLGASLGLLVGVLISRR